MSTSDAKKWRAEYKQSPDYIQCRTCLLPIGQHTFCLINRLPAFMSLLSKEFDCYQNVWHHAACIFEEKKRIREFRNGRVVLLDNRKIHDWNDVEGADTLLWRDEEILRKYIQEDVVGKYEIDQAEISGLVCKSCNKGIDKGQAIISHTDTVGDGRFQLSLHPQWHHANCFCSEFPEGSQLPGLPFSAPAPVRALSSSSVRIFASEEKREKKSLTYAEELAMADAAFDSARPDFGDDPLSISVPAAQNSVSNLNPYPLQILYTNLRALGILETGPGKKRLYGGRDIIDCETSQKRQKTSGSEANAAFALDKEEVPKVKESLASVKHVSVVPEPLSRLEIRQQQVKDSLQLKNELREHVCVTELKQMLSANDQDDTGSLDELLERCADGMLFGALARCRQCNHYMECHNEAYRCRGSFSGFNTCTFTDTARIGIAGFPEWSFGMACTNYYLIQLGCTRTVGDNHSFLVGFENKWKRSRCTRFLEPESPARPPTELFLEGTLKNPISPPISGEFFLWRCMFVTIGKFSVTQAKLKESILEAGGFMRGGASSIQSRSFLFSGGPFRAIVTTEKMLKDEELCKKIDYYRFLMEKCERPLPMVKEQFLVDCLDRKQLLPIDDYILEHTRSTGFSKLLKCRRN